MLFARSCRSLLLHIHVGAYGEAEFIFASIKVVTITGLIVSPPINKHFLFDRHNFHTPQILGIVLDLGGGPDHARIGFRFWRNPGPFVQYLHIPGTKGRFLGFWKVLTQAAFSFFGTEIVAVCILAI